MHDSFASSHKHTAGQGLAILLALALLLSLGGCGKKDTAKSLRIDLSGSISSLDAQLAATSLENCILQNSMEGLLRKLPDGTMTEGVASDYKISPDGLTYTFTLREDAQWSDGTPLTAEDFLFAFQRIFSGVAGAQPVQQFMAIRNGWQIYEGLMSIDSLGVSAPDAHTFVISLSEPDSMLLEKVAGSAAFPCNREFYESTHSRYGNSLDYMLFNGPFTVSKWEGGELRLSVNDYYRGVSMAKGGGVTCYLNRSGALDAFLSGETDFYEVDYETAQKLPTKTTTLLSFENGMVDLVFNDKEPAVTANRDIRRALCLSLEMLDFVDEGRLPSHYEYTTSLVPADAKVYNENYYDLLHRGFQLGLVSYIVTDEAGRVSSQTNVDYRHSNQLGISYSLSGAKAALLDSEVEELTGLTILVPENSDLLDFAGWMQKQWYDHLRVIVNLESVDAETYQRRLAAGDYTMAIYSYTAGGTPDTVFRGFLTGTQPVTFRDSRFQQLLEMARTAQNVSEAVRYYANAEALLLDEALAMPLFSTSTYFAMGEGVEGVAVSSDGSSLFFAGATRS